MRKLLNCVLPAVLTLSTSLSAFAHEGHGHENALSPEHYLVNGEHLAPIIMIALAIAALTRSYFIKRSRRTNGK